MIVKWEYHFVNNGRYYDMYGLSFSVLSRIVYTRRLLKGLDLWVEPSVLIFLSTSRFIIITSYIPIISLIIVR